MVDDLYNEIWKQPSAAANPTNQFGSGRFLSKTNGLSANKY